VVLVTVKSTVPAETGGGVDLSWLDRTVGQQVITRFDHHDLNQDPEFADRTTTGENLVLLIWDLLVKCIPAGQLEKVGLIETRDNYFEYAGSMSQAPAHTGGRHG
jgi:6-pyruvoyltetrahydropterin/6-carboxytetrahydropterin synthase